MNDIIKNIEAAQLKEEHRNFTLEILLKFTVRSKRVTVRDTDFRRNCPEETGWRSKKTFTVRKISNGIGVEKTWPVHSPNVEKVEVVRRGKVRRAKLNYLRDRVGKKAKVKELVK